MFQRSFAGEPLQLHGSSIGGHTVAVSESRRSRIESDTVIEKETNVRDVCVCVWNPIRILISRV